VIPADWQTHHSTVVDEATEDVACTVTIGPPDGGVPAYDATNGYTVSTGTPVYTGPAGIMPVSSKERLLVVAEEQIATLLYRVTLLADAEGVTVDHVVRVTSCDDPDLIGKTLTVGTIERGSRRFSRILLATLND
jgi:hypothetical protein